MEYLEKVQKKLSENLFQKTVDICSTYLEKNLIMKNRASPTNL